MAVFPTVENPEMDPVKLMHFALGVFFKAAVHSWRGDSSEPYMPMEADDVEALRLHLLGKGALPEKIVVCVTVDSLVVPLQSMNEPYRMADKDGFKVSVRRNHIDSYRLLAAQAVGVSSGSLWMDKLASPGRSAARY